MSITYECDDCQTKSAPSVIDGNAFEPDNWLVVCGEFLQMAGGEDGIRVLCPACAKTRGIKGSPWKWVGPPLTMLDVNGVPTVRQERRGGPSVFFPKKKKKPAA